MNQHSQYAFYGSLRRGMENYTLYERDLRYVKTVVVEGFKMYSLTDYPYVVRSHAPDKIVADLFTITHPQTEQIIHEMELEAGYIFEEVEIARIKFGIYVVEVAGAADPPVESGDWCLFKGVAGF